MKYCLKTENDCLKTQTKHPLKTLEYETLIFFGFLSLSLFNFLNIYIKKCKVLKVIYDYLPKERGYLLL